MSKEDPMTCPVCHTTTPIALWFASEEACRTFRRLVGMSIPLGTRVMRYLTLFTPPKTRLTQGKQLKLIEQLLPDLERRAITQNGQDWQAPIDIWSSAFERVFTVADAGRLTLPLSGHNYLYTTIRDLSEKAAAKAEDQAERERRETPKRGPVQIKGSTSIGALIGQKDPALADLEQRTSQATKPDAAMRERIAAITGRKQK